jgi:hypothetical protein
MSKTITPAPGEESSHICAKEGETMWVLLNHVKAEKCKDFEHFIHDLIMPIIARTEPDVLYKTRVLHPTQPNQDGTYTYIFLMDPVVGGGKYDFSDILKQDYPPEKIDEYLRLFNDAFVGDQVKFVVTQSAW